MVDDVVVLVDGIEDMSGKCVLCNSSSGAGLAIKGISGWDGRIGCAVSVLVAKFDVMIDGKKFWADRSNRVGELGTGLDLRRTGPVVETAPFPTDLLSLAAAASLRRCCRRLSTFSLFFLFLTGR